MQARCILCRAPVATPHFCELHAANEAVFEQWEGQGRLQRARTAEEARERKRAHERAKYWENRERHRARCRRYYITVRRPLLGRFGPCRENNSYSGTRKVVGGVQAP